MDDISRQVFAEVPTTEVISNSRENAAGILVQQTPQRGNSSNVIIRSSRPWVADARQLRSSQRDRTVSSEWASILEGSAALEGSLSILAAGPCTEYHGDPLVPVHAPAFWPSCITAGIAASIPAAGACSTDTEGGVVIPCTPAAMLARLACAPAATATDRSVSQTQRYAVISRCSSSCSLAWDELCSDDREWTDQDLQQSITPITGPANHAGPLCMLHQHAFHSSE